MQELDVYSMISPTFVRDVGVCYYCGCESEYEDFAPPKQDAEYYIKSRDSCSFAVLPCCKECNTFLEQCREGLIEKRKKFVNIKISRKYKKALNIYERWDDTELDGLSHDLSCSVKAGIELGGEAYSRLRFPGFEYEIDGTVFHANRRDIQIFSVFGEEFDSFRNALQYASRSYRININVLKIWLMDYNTVFDDAIDAFHLDQEEKLWAEKKNKLCKEFAEEHKQNSNFIKGALNAYEEANPNLTLEQCLVLIYEDRVKNLIGL